MPRSISALSAHKLFSEYRGPRILNEEGAPPPPAAPATPPKEGEGANPPATPPANPADEFKTRLTDLETKNKELKTKLKEKEDAEKAAAEAKLAEAGEHQKLAEQYKNESQTEKAAREAAETRAARFETQMKKQIEEQVKAISDAEKQKKITELLGNKPVEEQMEMLPNLLSLMGVAPQSFGNPTPTSSATPDKTEEAGKQKRFDELLLKETKEGLSSQERQEKYKLATQLSSFLKT